MADDETIVFERTKAGWTESDDVTKLMQAMLLVQAELPAAEKNQTGQVGSRNYKYADLAACKEAGDAVLTKHGIVVSSIPDPISKGTWTEIRHAESGQWRRFLVPWVGEWDTMQRWGSANTYARRYGYEAGIGLARVQDDDAREASAPSTNKVRKVPAKKEIPPGRDPRAYIDDKLQFHFQVKAENVPLVRHLLCKKVDGAWNKDNGEIFYRDIEAMADCLNDAEAKGVDIRKGWTKEEIEAAKQEIMA